MSTVAIEFRAVCKRFGAVRALDQISFAIQKGEFFSLLGPSGCGKTTLLRITAGFERPDSGELIIGGNSMLGIPPQQRSVNTVFQNYALFPHLRVFDNVAFGLRMKKTAPAELRQRVGRVMELVCISELSSRFPGEISGGQKQRVALARALVNEPAVLLLDEPLAAIDAKLRAQLQTELKSLQRKLGTTFVYVTHDQDEALALSDRIAVLQSGRVEQIGSPSEIYGQPHNKFVATFVGACNVFDAQLRTDFTAQTPFGILQLKANCHSAPGSIILGIRREKIQICHDQAPLENTFRATIEDVSFNGSQTSCVLSLNGLSLSATQPSSEIQRRAGDQVNVHLPAQAIMLLPNS